MNFDITTSPPTAEQLAAQARLLEQKIASARKRLRALFALCACIFIASEAYFYASEDSDGRERLSA